MDSSRDADDSVGRKPVSLSFKAKRLDLIDRQGREQLLPAEQE